MLKKMNQVAMMLAGIVLACVQRFKLAALIAAVLLTSIFIRVNPAHAGIGAQISSTTNVSANSQVPFIFFGRRNESVFYALYSTSPITPGTTVNFEMSTNMSNWSVIATTASGNPGTIGAGISGTIPPLQADTFLRFNIISTGAAPVPLTCLVRDVDDISQPVIKNNKQTDLVYFNDDSVAIFGTVKEDRHQYQPAQASSGSVVTVSSFTQFQWGMVNPINETYAFSLAFTTNAALIDKTFVVLQTTGIAALAGAGERGVLLSATPTITTMTATLGDRIEFHCVTSSITFTDAAGLTTNGRTTALRLGAATRSCGLGDTLALIFRNGFWYEEYFTNNINE